jgi:hypothetical protein
MKIHPVEAELFHADRQTDRLTDRQTDRLTDRHIGGQTDRQTDMTKLIVACHNFVNVHKNSKL